MKTLRKCARLDLQLATEGKNPNDENSGVSIIPSICITPTSAVLIAWGLNKQYPPDIGFLSIVCLFAAYGIYWVPSFLITNRRLDQLRRREYQTSTSAQKKKKHPIGQKLKGTYPPPFHNWLTFLVSSAFPATIFAVCFCETFRGGVITFSIVFIILGTVFSELLLRTVTVHEDFIACSGPLKIYRQNIKTEEIDGIARNGDYPVEVLHENVVIVFASNLRFKKTVSELTAPQKEETTQRK